MAANALSVRIVTPTALAWEGEATDVQAPGLQGEFGVYPKHIPYLTVIVPGLATVRTAEGVRRFAIGEGFAEAGPEHVVILAASCEDLATVDRAAAQKDLAAAEALLAQHAEGTPERANAAQKAALARARLR
jgi:F-type H+-transporting ATPase subunit epsilon